MVILFSKKAENNYKKLPLKIKLKADKQFLYLLKDYRHPSLRAKKMGGRDIFEARIDIHYRFTFRVAEDEVYILTIGPHDEGLGRK